MNQAAPSEASRRAANAQKLASHPERSAWVDASAGSGKTKVLTDRALRLMLRHRAPERILCLTFTKAAAAEMANRLTARLAEWSAASEADIAQSLADMMDAQPSEQAIRTARSLFARVVDAPGGLKVQTVHSFCQGALERFPIEAGAPPSFEALDERGAAELRGAARDAVLRRILANQTEPALAAALNRMALRGGVENLDAVLLALLQERARLAELAKQPGGATAAVLRALGFKREDDLLTAEAEAADLDDAMLAALRRVGVALGAGGTRDRERADKIAAWLAADTATRRETLAGLRSGFFKDGGEGPPFADVATKAVVADNPWLLETASAVIETLAAGLDRVRAADRGLDTLAALRLAEAIGDRYDRMKAARAALDFDDLILKTRDLLQSEGGAGWALYKLDQGIDHILVDEAQDTNPEQWDIVRALTGEFFQPDAALRRTVFAVGDPKQSIFSFQRADPAEFHKSQAQFRAASEAAGLPFAQVPLEVSFRSVPAVLQAVDATFAEAPALDGLSPDGAPPRHSADRAGLPGHVEFWPVMPAAAAEESDPWTPLQDYPAAGVSAEARLAEAIAKKIADLIADPEARIHPTRSRPTARRIEAGDIMVVVQTRRAFGDALERALKARGVPTAGVDRMRLISHIAVRDLTALGQVAALPEDDLSLAVVLKSPLCHLSEEQLLALAYGRQGAPLWRRLEKAAAAPAADAKIRDAWALIAEAMERADFAPPFDFFEWALSTKQGRARLVANMGPAVLDPIEEFQSLALRYASDHPASLTGFLDWIGRDTIDVKRELEGAASGVRLMTTHAAKGLQAPVVFLPDTTRGEGQDKVKLYWTAAGGALAPILGASSKDNDPALVHRLRDARVQALAKERQRLLYVAMTRAEDRLYIAGWYNGKTKPGRVDGCWHALVEAGMRRMDGVAEMPVDYADEPALIYADAGAAAATPAEPPSAAAVEAKQPDLPDWWGEPLLGQTGASSPKAPSGGVIDDPADAPGALSPLARGKRQADAAIRFGRGLLIHKLLERLPAVAADQRARVGQAYLRRAASLGDGDLDAILTATLALLDDPAFGQVFSPAALAEAPIAGTVSGAAYAGVIDRLLVAPDRVVIVDFKTNRPPPRDAQATAPAYLRQMALYRALARQAFPGRRIEAALLWTEAPRLDLLDDGLLDAFAPGE